MELLDAVYANPKDDAPRRVYADWLIAKGDLRGELIVLQCERSARSSTAAEQRAAQLLLKYGRSWLEPYEKVISAYQFRRGFLAKATLKRVTKAMVGDPFWSTVEELTLPADDALAERFVSHAVMRSLRKVSHS